MQYLKKQRLDIGSQLYHEELTRAQAAEKYNISEGTAREYMRLYRDENQLPPKKARTSAKKYPAATVLNEPASPESYESMTKEELIQELAKAKIAEARLKKGYEVKGDGSVIHYVKKNTK